MFALYKASVYIHILCAIFWIGGMVFTGAILVPTVRQKVFEGQKGRFFTVMGQKFSHISWVLFLLIIITGIFQLWYRWIGEDFGRLLNPPFWHSHFGITLAWKLILFAFVLIISGFHDFWLGPTAAQLIDDQPKGRKTKMYRKASSWIGRLNLLLGLLILYFAITLVRG